jgi:hypothetical protein
MWHRSLSIGRIQSESRIIKQSNRLYEQLCIEGLQHGSSYNVTLRAGLPSTVHETLSKSADFSIYVRDRKPAVHFSSTAPTSRLCRRLSLYLGCVLLAAELAEPLRDQAFLGQKAHERDGEGGLVAIGQIEVLFRHVRDELL